MSLYDFEVKTIEGKSKNLTEYRGQVILVVNVASHCGFTPQYKELEALYKKYKNRGFTVLGFPCNQFGGQEPANEMEIKEFCELNYGVTFPLFEKIDVNGTNEHPLFKFLKSKAKGFLGTRNVKWNFTKFLVDRKGEGVQRFAPQKTPDQLEQAIERTL